MPDTSRITAPELVDGDVYWSEGYQWRVSEIRHGQTGGSLYRPRSEWIATWTGVEPDPGPGWRSIRSAGNELLTVDLVHPEPHPWDEFGQYCEHDNDRRNPLEACDQCDIPDLPVSRCYCPDGRHLPGTRRWWPCPIDLDQVRHGERDLTDSADGFRSHCLCGWTSKPCDFKGSARLLLGGHLDSVPPDSIVDSLAGAR